MIEQLLTEAAERQAEGLPSGTEDVWHVDLDHSTVLLGDPGIWDGITFATWTPADVARGRCE